jgi:hypothetical protein
MIGARTQPGAFCTTVFPDTGNKVGSISPFLEGRNEAARGGSETTHMGVSALMLVATGEMCEYSG